MRHIYSTFIVVPLLLLIWGCGPSGSIRLDTGADATGTSAIENVVKVSGTRATIQFDVSENILYTSANVMCMDKIYGDVWKDAAAFVCAGNVSLTPGETQTFTLAGFLPNHSYLVRFVPLSDAAMTAKADSSEDALSSDFEVSALLREITSDSWKLSYGISCDTGDANGDGLADFLCGWSSNDKDDMDPQVGLLLGTGAIPTVDAFPIVKFTATDGVSPGACNMIEDINGDGHDDVVIGDQRWDDPLTAGDAQNGAVYIFYGPLSASAGADIALNSADQILTNTLPDIEHFGASCVYMRNLGYLLIGWPGYTKQNAPTCDPANGDRNCGAVDFYQYNGSEMAELPDSPYLKDYGAADAKLGVQMSVGDYDGDGLTDLHYQFTMNGAGGEGCRDTRLMLSSLDYAPPGDYLHQATLCLPDVPGLPRLFAMTDSNFIDVNQDGYDDFIVHELIIEPPYYQISIYYGGTTLEPKRKEVLTGSDQVRYGLRVGDINYDGLPELLIGGTLGPSIYAIAGGAIGDELGSISMRDRFNAILDDMNGDGYPEFINIGNDYMSNAYFVISY